MTAPRLKFTVVSAPIYRRLCAYVVDYVLVGAVAFAIYWALDRVPFDFAGYRTALRSWPAFGALWLYCSIMEASPLQATIGKMVFRMRVCDYSCRKISFWRAALRYLARAVLGSSLFVMMWTFSMQGLHDLLTHTIVLETRDLQTHIRNMRTAAELAARNRKP